MRGLQVLGPEVDGPRVLVRDVVDGVLHDGHVFLVLDPGEQLVDALDGAQVEALRDVLDELLALVGGQIADGCAVALDAVEGHVAVVVPPDQKALVIELLIRGRLLLLIILVMTSS